MPASTCLGVGSLALLPGLERPPIRAHSSTALQKFVQLVNTTVPPFTPSPPNGKKKFLKTSMAYTTIEACEYVCIWITLAELQRLQAMSNKRPPWPCYTDRCTSSRILGPISRHPMAQVIPMICNAARASRPGFSCWNSSCFMYWHEVQNCRVGCPDEPDYHRRNTDNPGNFAVCMEGRIRLLTGLSPTYAHAYQSLCLAGSRSTFLAQGFACQLSRPGIRIFLTLEPQHVKKAMIFKDGLFVLMEELASLRVKPHLVGALSPALPMEDFSITTEAHVAYAGARLHSNNSAELSSITEALSPLGPNGPVARNSQAPIFCDSKLAAGICLRTIQSRANVPLDKTAGVREGVADSYAWCLHNPQRHA